MKYTRAIYQLLIVLLLTFLSNSQQAALYAHHCTGSHSMKASCLRNVLKKRPTLPHTMLGKQDFKKNIVKERASGNDYIQNATVVCLVSSFIYQLNTRRHIGLVRIHFTACESVLLLRGPPGPGSYVMA